MINLGTYNKDTDKNKSKQSFAGAYVEEVYESENVRTYTRQLYLILGAKY